MLSGIYSIPEKPSLFTKMGFGKSFIFSLALFIFNLTKVIIFLMLLKLLLAEQNSMINQVSDKKAIVLTGENNAKSI